ncbi:M15 family metallopeptidase [Curtobacterium flaccumfaciens]|uniref:M15 family metallopeptidase n=1 Tax=Curtobacterium flaccumfaciens TaxID=2035 RepID=UPI0011277CB6|nr:M15 family metallopeptidase [Curtobacterium flaccumfaciens]TPG05596.1 hypothetical protein EAH85_12755 [Curtobacterium flaccumfaciens]
MSKFTFSSIYSVGPSSYGDRRGIEQFVTSARVALQVLTVIVKFNAYLRQQGRTGSLSVNEAKRTRARQSFLWANRFVLGVVVAAPFTSPHDEVNHGNAIDFGITEDDGSNRALSPDEFTVLHNIVAAHGGTWTGVNFGEPWHHEMATRAENELPYFDARERLTAAPAAPSKPAAPAAPPKPPTPKREVDMIYVTSDKTKKKYAIGELSFTPVSDSRATTYSKAVPGETSLFQTLTSAQVSGLIQDCRDRRDSLGVAVSAKFEAAVKAALQVEDAA